MSTGGDLSCKTAELKQHWRISPGIVLEDSILGSGKTDPAHSFGRGFEKGL